MVLACRGLHGCKLGEFANQIRVAPFDQRRFVRRRRSGLAFSRAL
jgi:hypothetical protein